VRLIDETGAQIGVVPLRVALAKARDAGFDLVEISPNISPPVCKILDYGKFRFQEQKKAAEAKKNQQASTLKEITLRPTTEDHDYLVKLRHVKEFLEEGHKVKFNIRFRGREVQYQQHGQQFLDRIVADLTDIARVETRGGLEGRFMSMTVAPLPKKG
jgi:translation initiation factor IF-3